LYYSSNINRVINSRRMRLEGHVARMGEMRSTNVSQKTRMQEREPGIRNDQSIILRECIYNYILLLLYNFFIRYPPFLRLWSCSLVTISDL